MDDDYFKMINLIGHRILLNVVAPNGVVCALLVSRSLPDYCFVTQAASLRWLQIVHDPCVCYNFQRLSFFPNTSLFR